MKYLAQYMEEKQTLAFEKYGAFFAFDNKQLKEEAVKGVEYMNMGGGMVAPINNCKALHEELDKIYKESIKQDISENGLEQIILRELNNHEAYYTGDTGSTIEALSSYPITVDNIEKLFNNKNYKIK